MKKFLRFIFFAAIVCAIVYVVRNVLSTPEPAEAPRSGVLP